MRNVNYEYARKILIPLWWSFWRSIKREQDYYERRWSKLLSVVINDSHVAEIERAYFETVGRTRGEEKRKRKEN